MNWRHVHTIRIQIRWGDMDAMGHVNNTVYFRYLEHARVEWLSAISATPNPEGEGPVIVNAHCTFMKQLTYPGEIELRTMVSAPGRSSFETRQEIRRIGADGQVESVICAEGGAKVVWVDFKLEKSKALPERIRALLAASDPPNDAPDINAS